jgi:sulfide:quinone oxidoreductase
MTTDSSSSPHHVVIAGGGVAALEAMMALRVLAGDRVRITLLAPERDFHYRPMAVAEPFSLGRARHIALVAIAADFDAQHVAGALAGVEHAEHRVVTHSGRRIAYDALVIACGTRMSPAFAGAITIDDLSIGVTLRGLVQDVEEGHTHRIAFVAPAQAFWPLPLYELALMTAQRAYDMQASVEISIVSPESAPLGLFGAGVSDALRDRLRDAAIAFHGSSFAERADGGLTLRPGGATLAADRVVALPLLHGTQITGVPTDPHGFIPVTDHGEVRGMAGVYAAGDVTAYPIKHGGLAAQQADCVAAAIASRAGAPVEPQPLQPVLQGMLMTGREPLFFEADIGPDGAIGSTVSDACPWDPSTKVAARHLGPYIAHGERYALPA